MCVVVTLVSVRALPQATPFAPHWSLCDLCQPYLPLGRANWERDADVWLGNSEPIDKLEEYLYELGENADGHQGSSD